MAEHRPDEGRNNIDVHRGAAEERVEVVTPGRTPGRMLGLAAAGVVAVFAWSFVPFYGRSPCRVDTHGALIALGLLLALVATVVGAWGLVVASRTQQGEGMARSTCVLALVAIAPYVLSAAHVLPRFWDALSCHG